MKSFITALIAVLLAATAFAAQPAPPVYAEETQAAVQALADPPPAPDVSVTGYTVWRGDQINGAEVNTGSIPCTLR